MNNFRLIKSNCGGILVVLFIILLLIVGVVIFFLTFKSFEKSDEKPRFLYERVHHPKVARAMADMGSIYTSIEMYKVKTGDYPEKLQDLIDGPKGWKDKWHPLIKNKTMLKDPWGNDYMFVPASKDNSIKIKSFGADGKEGGEGLNQDLFFPPSKPQKFEYRLKEKSGSKTYKYKEKYKSKTYEKTYEYKTLRIVPKTREKLIEPKTYRKTDEK